MWTVFGMKGWGTYSLLPRFLEGQEGAGRRLLAPNGENVFKNVKNTHTPRVQ